MRRYWNESLETMPWAEVERWQLARISAQLPSIRHRSLMYSDLHAEIPLERQYRSVADLGLLPFTFKEHLREAQACSSAQQPFGRNQSVSKQEVTQAICSSGTTGRPVYYPLSARDVDRLSDAIANAWFTAGVRETDTVAHLVGLPMVAGGLPYADGFRRVGATLCWLGGFPTERVLREMRNLRVTALLSTTSFAMYLAEQWEQVGLETGVESVLGHVLCGGEPGLGQAAIRNRIRDGLGIGNLRETMGLGDVIPCMWAECDEEDGMHFTAQAYVAVELVDPESGQQIEWRPGAEGELVYTAFERDASPVVRYRSRDHVVVTGTACACGRTSPRVRCIGRTDDMLIYKGMNVFPTAVRDLVSSRFGKYVEPFLRILKDSREQVRFDDPLEVEVEARPGFDMGQAPELSARIEADIRSLLQVRASIKIRVSGSLPRSNYKNALVAVKEG